MAYRVIVLLNGLRSKSHDYVYEERSEALESLQQALSSPNTTEVRIAKVPTAATVLPFTAPMHP